MPPKLQRTLEDGDADTATRTAQDIEDAQHPNVGAAEHTNGAEQTDLDARMADEAGRVQTGASEDVSNVQIFQVIHISAGHGSANISGIHRTPWQTHSRRRLC